ncbi:hypothetical protein QTH90_10710 [Variovorax sp. J2P1-59]|uniref:hypothetical protein n=1 Tax=Variovorax flavidus TaxID=3053501 RepID=UPI002576DE69|nr:hypothetical protein [Variovorax sp. J2P1-59]MDM0074853.1 hypothetical protein [Variovorax sp. J2P1-59]
MARRAHRTFCGGLAACALFFQSSNQGTTGDARPAMVRCPSTGRRTMPSIENGDSLAAISRRQFTQLLTGSSLGWMAGCATPQLPSRPEWLKPAVRKSSAAPKSCIDVHAHFFNATDVPVRGFLEGPVAHEKGGIIGRLIRLLGPVAQALAEIPPTASEEFESLTRMSAQPGLLDARSRPDVLESTVLAEQQRISSLFYGIVRNQPFEKEYNSIVETRRRARPSDRSFLELNENLNPSSVANAMALGKRPRALPDEVRAMLAKEPYPEGVLAFVGCMLSPRWMNVREFGEAYSSAPGAFGMDHAFGALVDFEKWLEPVPRSGQDDQIRLHLLLSQLSGGYMRPLVGYNPWRDIEEQGGATRRVVEAVKHGFVGVKIYPPNGFRPFGNLPADLPRGARRPSAQQLNDVLGNFWDQCIANNIPVMAHGGASMGSDDAHNKLAGPEGWEAILMRNGNAQPPRANVGHFGGDTDQNGWTQRFAKLMGIPEGSGFYADLGYWDKLSCSNGQGCAVAQGKLRAVLQMPNVAKRVMYGSDWHMLVQERDWWSYPFDIAEATKGMAVSPQDLFGGNAAACFASTLGTPAP